MRASRAEVLAAYQGYQDAAPEVGELNEAALTDLQKEAMRVAEKLIEGAEDFEEVSGPNYWLAKLYRALAGNDDFCDGGFEAVRAQPHPQ
jgi:hypothetical protein